MARKDVTSNTATSFEELASQLRQEGFEVDHFHAVDIDQKGGEWVTHFNEVDDEFLPDQGQVSRNPQGWHKLVADEWHEQR